MPRACYRTACHGDLQDCATGDTGFNRPVDGADEPAREPGLGPCGSCNSQTHIICQRGTCTVEYATVEYATVEYTSLVYAPPHQIHWPRHPVSCQTPCFILCIVNRRLALLQSTGQMIRLVLLPRNRLEDGSIVGAREHVSDESPRLITKTLMHSSQTKKPRCTFEAHRGNTAYRENLNCAVWAAPVERRSHHPLAVLVCAQRKLWRLALS